MPSLVPLRPGLWLVETSLEDFDVRGVVVKGWKRAIIWDTLARPDDMEGVAELAGDLPLTVVYSHGDWDHVWGTGGLTRPWEEVLAHEACAARFREEIPGTLTEKRASVPGTYDNVALVPPNRTFRTLLTLDLGGIILELHALPGHTPDTIVGYIPEWGVLLGGDAVESPLPFLNPGGPIEAWARGLEGWVRRLEGGAKTREEVGSTGLGPRCAPDDAAGGALTRPVVIPSHGPVGGTGLLRANAQYLRALATGKEPDLPGKMTAFYRETHAANRVLARR